MQGIFGAKKNKDAQASISDASDSIYKKGDSIDEKIKRLDAELVRYKEQIKKTRPGTAHETIKARAIRLLKQKKVYESQRDMLYSQSFKLDKVSFAADEFKDAQQTRGQFQAVENEFFLDLLVIKEMAALKSANKELKGMMETVNM